MIITFYSYKGGVGRSMAVANIAKLIVRKGYRVVAIDWDLEAPGLHRYFNIKDAEIKLGIIDYFYDYINVIKHQSEKKISANKEENEDNAESQYSSILPDIKGYTIPVIDMISNDEILFVPSGKQDTIYADRVNQFDWQNFYKHWEGERLIEHLKKRLDSIADYILIDSRTGITDIGGICTLQLPDIVVLMFSTNLQGVKGTEWIAYQLQENPALKKLGKKLEIIPIPSRIETFLEEEMNKEWNDYFKERLSKYIPSELDVRDYFSTNSLPYIPFYSFGEKLVVDGKIGEGGKYLLNALSSITDSILQVSNRLSSVTPVRKSFELIRGLSEETRKTFCLNYDPFFRGPLTRHHFREGLIDVRTDMINEMDNVYDQMLNTDDSKTVLLSGRRGTGKTSALIYLQNRLFDLIETEYMKHMGERRELDRETTKDLILPFYVNVIGRRENITNEILREDIHRSIFDTMINTLNRLDKLFPHTEIPKRINEITTREQGRELHKPREIEGSIGNLVELVAEYFTRFCVILDDADKYSPNDYSIIESYFNQTQAFYEMLMGKKLGKQTVGFILIPTQIVMGKYMAHQVSFLGDIEINFNKWRNNEIIQLIEKRFRKAHMKNPLINVTEIIESKVLNELYNKNNANPRFIQVALQQLMNKAAENVLDPDNLNISLSHNICQGKISYAFAKKHLNLLIGGTYKIQLDGEEDLQSLVKREYSEVYNKLLDIVWERPEEGGDIIETICEIKQRGLSDNISALRILMDRGIIKESGIKGRAGLHKEYDFEKVSLSEQMDKLVTVLYKELKEWTEVISLLYYMCI